MKHYRYHSFCGLTQSRSASNPFGVKKVVYSPEAIDAIFKSVGMRPAESGGAQFGLPQELRSPLPYVRKFFFDPGKNATRATYTIDDKRVNKAIHFEWDNDGQEYAGQLHSHPYGCKYPSGPDMEYFHSQLEYLDVPYLITPIVFTQPDGGFQMFCYLVGPNTPAIPVDYCVMDDEEYRAAVAELNNEATQTTKETKEAEATEVAEIAAATAAADESDANEEAKANEEVDEPVGIDRQRQQNAVDQMVVAKSRLIVVGCGGSEKLVLDVPRVGISEIVLIDPDKVDRTNLCRQGYLPRQVGMYKVDALAESIKEIDPTIKVTTYPMKLQELTPEQEKAIFTTDGTDIQQIVAVFLTDSFPAQAHGNILALRYQIPAIWAGFYEKSMASEIFFYIPGVTPGCFRCAVSPRYKFQEEFLAKNGGKSFSVSSDCNTIFHSALLDAQIGMLILAILHNKVEGKTFSGWFGDHFDRNFIQMNVNPGYRSNLFDRVFAGSAGNTFLFESVWQRIEPERPPKYDLCPDCHGGPDYHPEDPAE